MSLFLVYRGYRLLSGSMVHAGLLLLTMFAALVQAEDCSPPDHYILLLDDSGTMGNGRLYSIWGNSRRADQFPATLKILIGKAMGREPESQGYGWKKPRDCDLLSYAAYRLDYLEPSYALDHLFFSNEQTLNTIWGAAKQEGFSYPQRKLYTKEEFSQYFIGHTPHYASRLGIFPYLGEKVNANKNADNKPKHVGRVFLIRISDGDYNGQPNPEERLAIRDLINNANNDANNGRKIQGKKAIDTRGLDEYKNIEPQLEAIAANLAFTAPRLCLLTIPKKNTKIADIPLQCDGDAAGISPGNQLAFLYFEVKPNLQPNSLATLEKTIVHLKREAKSGEIWWYGDNRLMVFENAVPGMEARPASASLKISGSGIESFAISCRLREQTDNPAAKLVQCLDEAYDVGPESLDPTELRVRQRAGMASGALPKSLDAHYEIVFEVTLGNGEQDLYPHRLEWREKIPANPQAKFELDSESYHSAFIKLWYNEDPVPLSDAMLKNFAGPTGSITAAEIAETSRRNQETNLLRLLIVGLGWPMFALLLAGCFPLRTWQFEFEILHSKFPIDFNHPPKDREEIIGLIHRKRLRRGWYGWLWDRWMRLQLALEVKTPDQPALCWEAFDGNTSSQAPVWMVKRGETTHKTSEIDVPLTKKLIFEPHRLQDIAGVAASRGPLELQMDCRLDYRQTGGSGFRRIISGTLPDSPLIALTVIPEAARFQYQRTDQISELEYNHGDSLSVASYRLENRATKHFSYPAKVIWELEATIQRSQQAAPPGAFYFVCSADPQDDLGNRISREIVKDDPCEIQIMARFDDEHVNNPTTSKTGYHLRILQRIEERPSIPERRDQIDLDTIILQSSNRTKLRLDLDRDDSGSWFSYQEGHPIPKIQKSAILTSDQNGIGHESLPLLTLGLENICKAGQGLARWSVQTKIQQAEQIKIENNAITSFVDDKEKDQGQLQDGGHRLEIALKFRPNSFVFQKKKASTNVAITVKAKIVPDNYDPGANNRHATWSIDLALELKHIPFKRTLAVDFGTTAIAVALASSGKKVRLLKLAQVFQPADKDAMYSQSLEGYAELLRSDADFSVMDVTDTNLKEPEDPAYLDMPALKEKIFNDPDSVIPSMKMLMVRNCTYFVQAPPYRDRSRQAVKDNHGPTVAAVFEGLLQKLKNNHIAGSIGPDNYYYLVATHPNTYRAVERDRLLGVYKKVFANESACPYPEDIRLLSESDAVLVYYLMKTQSLLDITRQRLGMAEPFTPDQLPKMETVLIWDIGGGTLDMTLADYERDGDYISRIKIIDRHAIEIAGNNLTECLARDIHEWLEKKLAAYQNGVLKTYYRYPIVRKEEAGFGGRAHNAMTEFYLDLEKFKKDFAKWAKQPDGNAVPMVPLSKADTETILDRKDEDDNPLSERYKSAGILVNDQGQPCWRPDTAAGNHARVGDYVSAFIKRVADNELKEFIYPHNGEAAPRLPDTVIVTGRTSLWPGLMEQLQVSLPCVAKDRWVHLADDPDKLKSIVVQGAAWSHFIQNRAGQELPIDYKAFHGVLGLCYGGVGFGKPLFLELPLNQTVSLDSPRVDHAHIANRGFNGRYEKIHEIDISRYRAAYSTSKFRLTMKETDEKSGHFRLEFLPVKNGETYRPWVISPTDTHAMDRGGSIIEVWPQTITWLEKRTPEEIAQLVNA